MQVLGAIVFYQLADVADRTPEKIQLLLQELMDNELIDCSAHKLLDNTKQLNTLSQCVLHRAFY